MANKLTSILNYRVSDAELPKYKLAEIPKLALGAAIIGGGIYGIVKVMMSKKEEDEMALAVELRKDKAAHAAVKPPQVSVRGALSGWGSSSGRVSLYRRDRGQYG